MKKFLALAVTLLGLTAQALTVGWSAYGTNGKSSEGGVTYTLQLSQIYHTASTIKNTDGVAGALKTGDYSVSNLAIAVWSAGHWSDEAKNIALAVILDGNISAISSSVEFQMNGGTGNKAYPGQSTKGFVSFDFSEGFEVSNTETITIAFLEGNLANADLIGQEYSNTAAYVYSSTNTDPLFIGPENALSFRASVESVPEPTALALLALGVAGVVIRRRRA